MSDVKPVLNQLNIIAKDFDATVKFYRRLGVNVPDSVDSPDGVHHTEATMPTACRSSSTTMR
jgi:catechol 2,3-dioxygenase-like lactoylglutathione lyase family enzyme